MDTRPIGIFDSGLGGLTAVRALAQTAPWESFIFFGDTKNAPYGDRTADDICALSRRNARFLRACGVKAVLVACNTSTTNALPLLVRDSGPLPVVGALEPSAAEAARLTRTGRIGVIATAATVRSGAYGRAIAALRPDAAVTALACPRLVPLIESGHVAPDDGALLSALDEYLPPFRAAAVDTLVLGCTHYPLVRAAIQRYMGPNVALVDAGAACVGALLRTLEAQDALGDKKTAGTRQFYCSARPEAFARLGSAFLGWPMEGVAVADIDRY